MTDLSFLSQKQQKALLEAVDILCRIFWGPDPQSSKEILEGTYLNPFKLLVPEVNYKPPGILSEIETFHKKFPGPNRSRPEPDGMGQCRA